DRLAGLVLEPLAQDVVHAVADLRFRGQLAQRRDAAVAEPTMLAIGAGAIEHDVRVGGALTPLGFLEQQAKRLPAAPAVAGAFMLEQAAPADAEDLGLGDNAP